MNVLSGIFVRVQGIKCNRTGVRRGFLMQQWGKKTGINVWFAWKQFLNIITGQGFIALTDFGLYARNIMNRILDEITKLNPNKFGQI